MLVGIIERWRLRRRCFHHQHFTGETWLTARQVPRGPLFSCTRCGTKFGPGNCYHHSPAERVTWIVPHLEDLRRNKVWSCVLCGHRWWLRLTPAWWQE